MKIHYLDWAEKIRKKYSQIGEYGFAGATLTFLQGEKHSEPQNGGEERRLMLFFQNLIFCWENSIGVKLSLGNERVMEKSARLALETAIQKLTSEEKTHFSREVKIARELLEGKEKTEIQMQKSLVFRRWQEGYSWEEISGHREIREYAERLEETRNRRQELAWIRKREIAGVQSRADAGIQSRGMEFAQIQNMEEVQNTEEARIQNHHMRQNPGMEIKTNEAEGSLLEKMQDQSNLVHREVNETADGTGSRAESRWENPPQKAPGRETEGGKKSQREIERQERRLEKQIENLKESIHWREKQQESQREFVRQEKRQQKAQSELRNIQTEQQKVQTELIRQQEKLTETRTQLEKDSQIQQMHEERGKEVLEQEKKRAVREETSRLEIEKERMRTEHQNRLEAESLLESTAERQNQPEAESGLENIPEWQNRGGEDASVESKLFREVFTVEPAGMEALERPESSLVYLEAKETADGTGIQSHAERRWERPSEKAHEREIESGKESQREIGRRESRLEKQMEKLKESIHWSEKQQESQREFARQEERQQKTKSELLNTQTELQKVQSEQVRQQEKLTETRTQLEKNSQILKHPESSLVYLESKETLDETGVQSRTGKQLGIPSEKAQPELRDTQPELQKMQTELIRQQEKLTETQIQLEKETQILKHPENSLVYLESKKAPDGSRQDKAKILLNNLSESASQRKKQPENRLFPGAVERMEKNVKTMEKVLERFRVVTETRKSVFSEPHIVEKHSNVRLEKLVSGTLQQKQEKIRTAALQQNHRVRTIKRIIPRLEVLPGNREMRLEILETVGKTSGYEAGQEFTSLPELSTTAKIQYTVPESRKTDRTNVGSEVSAISATLAQTREETRILRKNTGYTRTALIEQEKKIDGIRKELNTQMKQVNEEVRRLMDTQRRDMSVQNLAGKVMKELQRQFRTEKIRRGY